MSLYVNEGSSGSIAPLAAGTYSAVCSMLVDLGDQYSETFGNTQHKIVICWEIPDEALEDGSARRLSNTYTASLNAKGNLRRDLIAWRGRDFTVDELKKFDLRSIVGAPCLLQVIHKTSADGSKTRSVIGGIMSLPKGMPKPVMTGEPIIFDLDDPASLPLMDKLPEWMQTRIKEGETWKAMQAEQEYAAAEKEGKQSEDAAAEKPTFKEQIEAADGELPF